MASECPFTAPDYDYWPRGQGKCPIIFEEGGQPAGSTPHLSEVENLAQQVNAGDLSHLDMANVVTEMAVQTAMLHQDRCVKNHFYFHDEASDRWLVIPYDMKGASRDAATEPQSFTRALRHVCDGQSRQRAELRRGGKSVREHADVLHPELRGVQQSVRVRFLPPARHIPRVGWAQLLQPPRGRSLQETG